jgi:cytochrome c-type biogenesis protein CcmF
MTAEIAQILLGFSLALCLIYGGKGLWFSHFYDDETNLKIIKTSITRTAYFIGFLLIVCFLILMQLFVVSDFSVILVAKNSNALLPFEYKIAATWGSHEGSFLLWVLMLSIWTCAVSKLPNNLDNKFQIRVISILFILQSFFLAYLIFTSNPFERILPAPALGRDLNPLLQDPFMVIHPPMLYMGYVGFSVCFAMAMAALLDNKVDSTWARWSRPWANSAWSFFNPGNFAWELVGL